MEATRSGGEVREKEQDDRGGSLRRSLWLAGEDVRRTWLSYPASCVAFVFVGFLAIGPVQGIVGLEGFGSGGRTLAQGFNGFFVDLFFLWVCPALGINLIFNRDYGARYRRDNMSRRLAFLRGLAISPGEIVAGRALTMLLAFVVAVPAFFMPLFLVPPAAVESLGPVGYWSFAGIWAGYALFAGGFYMYAWLGFSGREDLKGALGLGVCFVLVAVLTNFALDIHLVTGSVGLAREYGPLVALPALGAGAAGFVLWALATRSKLSRRDLSV